jgi:hypothetical protein
LPDRRVIIAMAKVEEMLDPRHFSVAVASPSSTSAISSSFIGELSFPASSAITPNQARPSLLYKTANSLGQDAQRGHEDGPPQTTKI